MLGRWLDRRTIQPSRNDKQSAGSGDHRTFSRATINKIAIAKKLIDLGISAGPANAAASLFTDQGKRMRPANELYEFGRTLLVMKSSGTQILNADFNASLTDICGRPFETAILVDIGQTIRAVDEALAKLKKDNK
jgi:hypothetical protein